MDRTPRGRVPDRQRRVVKTAVQGGNGGVCPGEVVGRPAQELPCTHLGRSDAGPSAGTIHHCHGASSPDPPLMTGFLRPSNPDAQLIPAQSGTIAEGRLGARGILSLSYGEPAGAAEAGRID